MTTVAATREMNTKYRSTRRRVL